MLTGLGKFVNFYNHHVHAVVGDGCSTVCEPIASLGKFWKLPQVITQFHQSSHFLLKFVHDL